MKANDKRFFEIKSIFVTDDILKENEKHANIVTASTMFNLFLVILIGWILNQFKISNNENINMTFTVINSFLGLFIPAIICFCLKGNGTWLKYMLLGMFILILVTIDRSMSYVTAFLMVIPVILSARYYQKRFTILTSLITLISFIIFSFATGVDYITNYQLIIGALLLYYVVVFASVQIAQSGKNMILKQKEISEKEARVETELNLASAIQRNMLPSIFPPFPEREEVDLYAAMIPAKEVGGDFYDMFLIDDDHLAICVADVSGKGVPAALVMMVTKILIKNVTKIESEVDKAFTKVNNMLCEGNASEIFITCFFGILNLKTGTFEFVNAGHNPPLLYSNKLGNFEYLETKTNLVLAIKDDLNYLSQKIQIEPGDRIFLYTDGVVESTDNNSNQYGEIRLKNYLNNHLKKNATDTIIGVKKDLDSFTCGAPQFDDITMLELIYKYKKGTIKKEFKADSKELSKIQSFVSKALNNYSQETINEINLAIEEIFVNIAKYAYGEKKGNCTLEIINEKNKISFIFEDTGIKFNPLEMKEPNVALKAKKRKIGGLGIFLAKKIMDDLIYKYEDGKNILKLIKNIK